MARFGSTVLLVLVALAASGCDVERFIHWLSGDPPAGVAESTPPEREPADDGPLHTARVSEAKLGAPAPPSTRSTFNRIASTPTSVRKKRPSGAPMAPARVASRSGVQPGSVTCENVRSNVLRMEEYAAGIESEIERLEEQANDVELHAGSRERYEARVDAAEERLAQAEDQLHDYILDQQQAGIPQGCLR
jgi:hypothetical protein